MRKLTRYSVVLGLLLAAPSAASAATTYDGEQALTPFIRYWTYCTAGTQYTIETANLTANGDTVVHVLYYDGTTYQQIAANDDYNGLASRVVFTAPYEASYLVWVRGYGDGSAGNADLVINGSTALSQAPFGGRVYWMNWNAGEQFRVAGTRYTGNSDTMVFLLRSNTELLQVDDDNGPSLYPFAQASTSESGYSRVVYGLYSAPSENSYGRLIVQEAPSAGNDSDGDGLTNALENLIGTSTSNADSDNDAVPDGIEAIGGSDSFYWTFSPSASSPYGNNPTRRNAYVEVDYMTNTSDPTKSRQPYDAMIADSRDIFGADGDADLTVVIDSSLAWHQNIGLDGCATGVPDCVDFRTVKADYFSTFYPERRPYFHYNVFGYQYDNGCSSGLAEVLGNDFLVTLGCWSFTEGQQRGTFIHEFGHNLNLTHNGNGNNNGNNSTVHNSVMNYRYQIDGTSPNGRHTYSGGAGGCAPCATSPKQACINLRNANQCGTPAGATCDCDLAEWTSAINYDMTEGGSMNDGTAYARSTAAPTPIAQPINLYRPARLAAAAEKSGGRVVSSKVLASALAEERAKLLPQIKAAEQLGMAAMAQAKLSQSDRSVNLAARAAEAPKPNLERHRASVSARVSQLRSQGLVEGTDYVVASDGTAVYMP